MKTQTIKAEVGDAKYAGQLKIENGRYSIQNITKDSVLIKGNIRLRPQPTTSVDSDFRIKGDWREHVDGLFDITNQAIAIVKQYAARGYNTVKKDAVANKNRQNNDCAIIALTMLTRVSYEKAAQTLKDLGKRNNCGTKSYITLKAIEVLGYKAIRRDLEKDYLSKYPERSQHLSNVTPRHVKAFPHLFADAKNQIWFFNNHVAAFVNGNIEDWSHHGSRRTLSIYDVVKADAE